jgi:ParB family chromosome partitioning protein
MSPRKSTNLNNFFSGAKQSQQISEAEQEIQSLKAEIEELRASGSLELESQLTELRQQLESKAGVSDVAIEQIQPNKEQPRQTFLAQSIEAMANSLATYGQLEPIILIQGESLVIFDGERRWRSAKKLGWQSIKAVLMGNRSLPPQKRSRLLGASRKDRRTNSFAS